MKQKNFNTRMYVLVNRSLSPIQKGIQALHAVVEYGQKYQTPEYKKWAKNDKTVIILDGGTSNSNENGEMEKALLKLKELKYKFSEFREPDINNCLTAIAFIVDERIYDEDKYFLTTAIERKFGKFASTIFMMRCFLSKFKLAF